MKIGLAQTATHVPFMPLRASKPGSKDSSNAASSVAKGYQPGTVKGKPIMKTDNEANEVRPIMGGTDTVDLSA